mgnify:CR=1 FL=1
MDIEIPLLCLRIITSSLFLNPTAIESDEFYEERKSVCIAVAQEARKQEVDIVTALAVTWQESRFLNAGTNSSGCSGPMQIKVKYWCENKKGEWSAHRDDGVIENCNLIVRGVFALKYYLKRYKYLKNSLCGYGWGDCDTPEKQVYVESTLKYRENIIKILKRIKNEECKD